jgi:two-component system response regulator MprA
MKRILAVDDETPIRSFLKRGLEYKGFDVLEASTGEEALQQLRTSSPDLLLLDVVLPDVDGMTLCRAIREEGYTTLPILMLTAKDEISDKIAGLDDGADDYITKPFDFLELLAHIRAAFRRVEDVAHLDTRIQVGDVSLDTRSRLAWREGQLLELTKKEYDLLELLARNAGQVLTKTRIFERIWGYDNDAGLEVIKVYINYLRAKLNAGGKPDLIQAVRGVGYTLRADEYALCGKCSG